MRAFLSEDTRGVRVWHLIAMFVAGFGAGVALTLGLLL